MPAGEEPVLGVVERDFHEGVERDRALPPDPRGDQLRGGHGCQLPTLLALRRPSRGRKLSNGRQSAELADACEELGVDADDDRYRGGDGERGAE